MNTSKPEYIKVNIDTEVLNMEMEGEEFLKESTGYIVGNTIKDTTNAFYIEGCVSAGVGIAKDATSIIAILISFKNCWSIIYCCRCNCWYCLWRLFY